MKTEDGQVDQAEEPVVKVGPQQIESLDVEGFLGLPGHFKVEYTQNFKLLVGDSRKGKSSVVKGLWFVVKGGEATPSMAINKSANKAKVSLRTRSADSTEKEPKIGLLAERVVTRRAGGGQNAYAVKLYAVSEDPTTGEQTKTELGSPQKVLDALKVQVFRTPGQMVAMAKNPDGRRQFAGLAAKSQTWPDVELDKHDIQVGEDETPLDAVRRDREDAKKYRTEVNRDISRLNTRIEGVVIPAQFKDAKPVDVSALSAEKDALTAQLGEIDKLGQAVREADMALNSAKGQLDTAEQAVVAAEKALAEAKARRDHAKGQVAAATRPVEQAREAQAAAAPKKVNLNEGIVKTNEELAKATETNRWAGKVSEKAALLAELNGVKGPKPVRGQMGELELVETQITRDDQLEHQLIAGATSLVPGLIVDPLLGATYNGVPMDQWSDGETYWVMVLFLLSLPTDFKVMVLDGLQNLGKYRDQTVKECLDRGWQVLATETVVGMPLTIMDGTIGEESESTETPETLGDTATPANTKDEFTE